MVMRQMRENTKWIMLATALAFVALMVFEWGMDITGRSAGGLGEIGRVNGRPVLYDDYMNTYRSLYDELQRTREQPITSQENRALEDQAWEQVVTRLLIEEELERRGIEVSEEEIRSAALFSPPPAFLEAPEFLTDGQFDLQKYQSFIQSPQIDDQTLLFLETYYRDVIPRGKLLRQLTSGVYVTESELWHRWRDQNETVEVHYIPMNPSQRYADTLAPVTEREVQAYYDEHEDDFEVPAQAQVRVAVISRTPSPSDTAAARDKAQELLAELRGGADFAEVARRESSDASSAPLGGDLGTFGRGRMIPEFEEAAFAAPLGEVTEPVQTSVGLHLIRVQSRTADSVTASHILVPIQRTEESEVALLTRADSLEDLAESQGLQAAATALGLETNEVQISSVLPFVAGAGQVSEGADWAFEEAAPGDVSPVFENNEAFYAMELIEATPAGNQPLEAVRGTVEQILRLERKIELARSEASEIVQSIRAGTTFDNAAAQEGLEVRTAGPFSRQDFVPGLGRLNAAIGASFGLDEGEVSDPVEAASNVFILEKLSHTPADSASWVEAMEGQRSQVLATIQQQRLDLWLRGLRERADVVDRRAEVLVPASDTLPLQRGPFGF